jgi:hypothetical protein
VSGWLVLAVAAGPVAAGQPAFGFLGGVNLASLGGDIDDFGDEAVNELETDIGGTWSYDGSRRTGLVAGAYYTIRQSPTLGYQIEAHYVQRGKAFEFTGRDVPGVGGASVDDTFKLDYLDIPVLARFTPGADGNVRPIIFVGPVFGFRLSAEMEVETMGQSQALDISDDTRGFTVGLLGGIGLAFDAGPTSAVLLQARYVYGLREVFEDATDLSSRVGDLALLAGMEFRIGE